MNCTMDRLLGSIITSCFLIGISSPLVLAQDAESPVTAETTEESRPIEEITVLGQQTFFSLRMAIESLEEEVFGLFNELNSTDEFDIKCTREVYSGSHILKRVCMSTFLREALAQNTQDYLATNYVIAPGVARRTGMQLTGFQIKGEVSQKSQALEAEMTRLVLENESLFQALQKLTTLTGALEAKKEENFFFFK